VNDKGCRITLSQLILARLLTRGRKGETPANIRNGIHSLVGGCFNKADLLLDIRDRLHKLQQKGIVEPSSSKGSACVLTPTGRQEAVSFLGLVKVPGKIAWRTVRDTYLVPK